MAYTNRRYQKDVVIAVGHQTAFGTPAATTNVMQIKCSSVAINPSFQYVDLPRGTSGSYFPKDHHFKSAEMGEASLTMPCTKKNLLFFAEHALHGQPQSAQASSTLTIANDGAGYFASGLVLNGVRPHLNTDATWKLYATVTDGLGGTGHVVDVYKDSGQASGDKVCTGTGDDGASITLAESNSSGMSGTMTLGTVSGDDSDIQITIVSVAMQRSGEIARYFTLWRDTLEELERVIDCTVKRLKRSSEEFGAVMLDVDVVGTVHEGGLATAFTPSLTGDDKDVYLHDSVTYTSDVDSDAVAESVFSVSVELVNSIQVDVHNASSPGAIWKRNVEELKLEFEQRFADEAKANITSGLADLWTSERIVDTHDSKSATWLLDKAKLIDPKLPDTGEEDWDTTKHTFIAREESASSPSAPFSLTIAGP